MKLLLRCLVFSLAPLVTFSATAANFAATNIVVERVSIGTAPATSAATPVYVDEYLPATANQSAPVQSVSLPDATPRPTASPFNLMDSGSATSDGQLTRSADGTGLNLAGYNAISGDLSIVNSGGATNRVIGFINAAGVIDTSRNLVAFTNGNNFRSVVSVNGSAFWCGGPTNDTSVANLSGGIIYYTNGTAVKLASNDIRYLGIFGGQLFFSTQTAPIGIYALGSGLPTSPAAASLVIPLVGGTPSPVAFQFNPATNVCYVADSRGSKGGVFKFTYNGTAWVSNYLFGTSLLPNGANGLAVNWSGANPVLYITTQGGTNLIAINDTNAAATATILAKTDGSTNIFRGVALAPVTAPAIIITSSSYNPASQQFTLTWSSTAGASYSVLYSTNLSLAGGGFSPLVTDIYAGGLTANATVTVPAGPVGFVRIVSLPPAAQSAKE